MNKVLITLTDKELEALKKFQKLSYRGGYELQYAVKKGYNFEPDVESLICKTLAKVAKQARKSKKSLAPARRVVVQNASDFLHDKGCQYYEGAVCFCKDR